MLLFVLVFYSISLFLKPLIKAHMILLLGSYIYILTSYKCCPLLPPKCIRPPSVSLSASLSIPPTTNSPPLCLSLPRSDVTVTAVWDSGLTWHYTWFYKWWRTGRQAGWEPEEVRGRIWLSCTHVAVAHQVNGLGLPGQEAAGKIDGFSIFNDVSHSDTLQQIEHAGLGRGLEREEWCVSSHHQTRKQSEKQKDGWECGFIWREETQVFTICAQVIEKTNIWWEEEVLLEQEG